MSHVQDQVLWFCKRKRIFLPVDTKQNSITHLVITEILKEHVLNYDKHFLIHKERIDLLKRYV